MPGKIKINLLTKGTPSRILNIVFIRNMEFFIEEKGCEQKEYMLEI